MAGEDCFILKIRAEGPKQLERLLSAIRGSADTSRSVTNIVLSTYRNPHELPPLQWSKETDMSTLDISLLMNGVPRGAVRPADSTLRMVLVEGEALRLPLSRLRVSVLSGTAWVTQAGDARLQPGESFDAAAADRAVISPIGTVPLLFEIA